jgi:hypothetical protein
MLVSVFVESLHVVPPSDVNAYALSRSDALTTARPLPQPTDPYSCPACVWQRVSTQQASHIGITPARDPVPVLIVPLIAEWPDSPVPRPAAFRGPPRSTLA